MLHRTPLQLIWDVSMISTAALSIWRGGWAERTVAFGMAVSSIATAVFQDTHHPSSPQWADLTVDLIYLALLIWVALRSNRRWPLFAAAFQLVAVVIYFARLADWRVGARAPFLAGGVWSFLILFAVIFGVWLNGRDPRQVSPSTGSAAT